MKRSKKNTVLFIILLFIPILAIGQEEISSRNHYRNARQYLVAEARYELSRETIHTSQDEDTIAEAMKDLITYSHSLQKNEEALADVEALIGGLDENSELYGRANLAKARLLMRLGNTDDALALMKRGVHEKWKENAFWEINDGLLETGQIDVCAVDEYERNAGDEYDRELRKFYGIGADFSIFFLRLYGMKHTNPEKSAMDDVFPNLKPSTWRPQALNIARALCLAGDRRFEEALAVLNEVEMQLNDNRDEEVMVGYDEKNDIPFYKAVVSLLGGKDAETVHTALQNYMDLHPQEPTLIVNRIMELTYELEKDVLGEMKKISVLTGFLIQSDIVNNELIKSKIPENKIASIYDLHQQSLCWNNQFDESAQICKFVMENYPQTLAGANCAMNWARYISWREQDIDGAERILNGILGEANHDVLVPWVKHSLAEIALKRGDKLKALGYLNDILRLIPESDASAQARCREQAVVLKEQIFNY
jgi:tetratricopeptide (TPR) repeat protein